MTKDDKIYELIENSKIEPSEIVVIVPDETFVPYLKLFKNIYVRRYVPLYVFIYMYDTLLAWYFQYLLRSNLCVCLFMNCIYNSIECSSIVSNVDITLTSPGP